MIEFAKFFGKTVVQKKVEKVSGGYVVMDHKGIKRVSKVYRTRDEASKRMREMEGPESHKSSKDKY